MAVLSELRKLLDVKPSAVDIHSLLPIFVPASFLSEAWCGPYQLFRAKGVGLTWTILGPGNTMRYIDKSIQQNWEDQGIDWRAVAACNLKVRSTGENPFGTHALGKDPRHPFAVAMMNPDGLGPSRLLLTDALQKIFPGGYRVAMPEMSCGLAFGVNLPEDQQASVQEIITHCFEKGTRPLSPHTYSPEDLLAAL